MVFFTEVCKSRRSFFFFFFAPIIKNKTKGCTKIYFSEITTIEKKFGGGKVLTRIAIHILVKKGELLIWRKNGHFPHYGMVEN
jgi:DNA-binding transcriptional regulator PaaX